MSIIDPWSLRVPCECGGWMRLSLKGDVYRCESCPRKMSKQLVRHILLTK